MTLRPTPDAGESGVRPNPSFGWNVDGPTVPLSLRRTHPGTRLHVSGAPDRVTRLVSPVTQPVVGPRVIRLVSPAPQPTVGPVPRLGPVWEFRCPSVPTPSLPPCTSESRGPSSTGEVGTGHRRRGTRLVGAGNVTTRPTYSTCSGRTTGRSRTRTPTSRRRTCSSPRTWRKCRSDGSPSRSRCDTSTMPCLSVVTPSPVLEGPGGRGDPALELRVSHHSETPHSEDLQNFTVVIRGGRRTSASVEPTHVGTNMPTAPGTRRTERG